MGSFFAALFLTLFFEGEIVTKTAPTWGAIIEVMTTLGRVSPPLGLSPSVTSPEGDPPRPSVSDRHFPE